MLKENFPRENAQVSSPHCRVIAPHWEAEGDRTESTHRKVPVTWIAPTGDKMASKIGNLLFHFFPKKKTQHH